MTAKMIYEKFKTVFKYLSTPINVIQYKEINGDPHSIRIKMNDGTSYIFTYPPNGHYVLSVEKLGSCIKKEKEDAKRGEINGA